MENRINWIDWAKTIGIFLVVFGHYFNPPIESPKREIINFIYAFHMPFFFMLSGYLHKDSNCFTPYLRKCIRTLIIPYIILNILASCYLIIFSRFDSDTALYYFLTGDYRAPGFACWFLYCLFLVKIFSYILIKASKWVQSLLLILSTCLVYFLPNIFNFRIDSAIVATIFFIAGYYMKQYNILDKFKVNINSALLCLVLFIILFIGTLYNGFAPIIAPFMWGKSIFIYFINAFVGCFMLFIFCKFFDNIKFSFIRIIASGTLLIMAFHNVGIVYEYLQKYGIPVRHDSIVINAILSVLNIAILYYPIIFIQKYIPFILGGRK